MNADRQVDDDDRIAWVRDLKQTWSGDANLDGLFDDDDLVDVFQFGQYEDLFALNSQWSSGDWTGDGEFDSADLVAAFQDGGYLVGPRVPPPAIPEPHGLLLGCLALCSLHDERPKPWFLGTGSPRVIFSASVLAVFANRPARMFDRTHKLRRLLGHFDVITMRRSLLSVASVCYLRRDDRHAPRAVRDLGCGGKSRTR